MSNDKTGIPDELPYDDPVISKAAALLPAWFVPRMMSDEWSFGLLLNNGFVLAVSHIKAVRQAADGSIRLDVGQRVHAEEKLTYRLSGPPHDCAASISAFTRWTVPEPTPCSLAIFRSPLPP
jgi:hypothetical protein